MADRRDVVIIGAGIVGASVGFHLAQAGAEVVLVDDERAGRATRAGAGIVGRPWRASGSPGYALRQRSIDSYASIVTRVGATCDAIGQLYVAPRGPLLEEAREGLGRVSSSVCFLEPDEARRCFPYLSAELSAVRVRTTLRVDGEQLRLKLIAAAERAGAMLQTGKAELVAGRHGVEAVRVDRRPRATRTVVVAAGAWSPHIVAHLGIPLRVTPQRGQIVHLGVDEETTGMPVVQPLGADHYLLPFADRRVVVGATREAGAGFAPELTAGGVSSVLGDALSVAPGLAPARIQDLRVGLRPATPDGEPLLGAVASCPGLWIATGMGPHGLMLGPYSGKVLADSIIGRTVDVDLGPFTPLRAFS